MTFFPLVAIGVALCAVAVSKWVFAPSRLRQPDYGLLVTAVSVPTRAAAEHAHALLHEHGIRATLGYQPPIVRVDAEGHAKRELGGHNVLVFPADLTRAKAALSG